MPLAARRMALSLVLVPLLTGGLWLTVAAQPIAGQADKAARETEPKRPRLLLRALPNVAVAPARIVFSAELQGGSDGFEEFYCPTIEWDWGDGTRSESTTDCEPFEAGKTVIKRRYTVEHVFRRDGPHKVYFNMKRKDKLIATVSVMIQLQPGAGSRDFSQ